MEKYLYLSIAANLFFGIIFFIVERSIRKQDKELLKQKEIVLKCTMTMQKDSTYKKVLENKIHKLELDIENKKGTIKYLSDQNIILNAEVGNIEQNYIENSEAIKQDRLKKGNEKFIHVLQTSKEN